jgi:hypothetical protein
LTTPSPLSGSTIVVVRVVPSVRHLATVSAVLGISNDAIVQNEVSDVVLLTVPSAVSLTEHLVPSAATVPSAVSLTERLVPSAANVGLLSAVLALSAVSLTERLVPSAANVENHDSPSELAHLAVVAMVKQS